jgi:hypothetical protein
MVALHGSPDRDRRFQRARHRRALAEATERPMHRCDQTPDLIDTDTVLPDITPNNLRDQTIWALLSSAISFSLTSLIEVYIVAPVSIAIYPAPNIRKIQSKTIMLVGIAPQKRGRPCENSLRRWPTASFTLICRRSRNDEHEMT